MSDKSGVNHHPRLPSRRVIIHGGLTGLAAALLQSQLSGCTPPQEAGALSGDAMMTPRNGQPTVDQSVGVDASTATDIGDIGDLSEANDQGTRPPESGDVGMMGGSSTADFPRRILPEPPQLVSLIAAVGPLLPADENGLRLPEGFSSRVVARTGDFVGETEYRWHAAPDGGAAYPTEDGGWIYVSNSEIPIFGGASAIRFDARGSITDAYQILSGSNQNCAGGKTPWHTWLSCEEMTDGQVYECSPWGDQEPILRPALGTFKHEAVAVDPSEGYLYLTEDETDGGFYRFTATRFNADGSPRLDDGLLEVASVSNEGVVSWLALPDPQYTGDQPTRYQRTEMTAFDGGEGIWFFNSVVYFSTKGDNRVWAYHTRRAQLETIYDGEGELNGVDNLTVSCCGDVLVAEDGGSMQIVAIAPDGELKTLVQIEGQDGSEVTGPAFDPSGTRLYFSSQRGPGNHSGDGITYEVTGPFHRPA